MNFLFFIGTIISFILAGYIIWIHGIKPKRVNVESRDFDKFRDEVSKLITEFNRVSNTNINILEDKIEDLKNIIKLADDKIIKLNSKLTDLEILANRNNRSVSVKEPVIRQKIKPLPKKATLNEKKERIKELVNAGFSIEEIAKAVNMSKGEVQLVLELKNKI
jgi:predicted  nucleic acid-binding Zn-ribbon protein